MDPSTPTPSSTKRKADDTEKKEVKRFRPSFQDIVTVIVGEDGEELGEFFVYRDLICNRSTYFKKACSGDWMESSRSEVHLRQFHPDTFKIYLEWVLDHSVDMAASIVEDMEASATEEIRKCRITHRLWQIWQLADCLGDPECKNAVTTVMHGEFSKGKMMLGNTTTLQIFEKTSETATIRKLVLDVSVYSMNVNYVNALKFPLPADFTKALLLKLVAERPLKSQRQNPFKNSACQYHEHPDGETECK